VLENQATVTAVDECDGFTVATDVSEIVEVYLVHPGLTVEKVCLTPPDLPCGEDAEFLVTIENTGDVDLICTTDEPGFPGPFTLPAGGVFEGVVTALCECPPGEVTNAITVTATIPPEYCGLPNELVESSEATCYCSCPDPCVEITKVVDCEWSKVGDEVIYSICITNCGEYPLIDVVVTDTRLDLTGIFPTTLAVGEEFCADIPYTVQPGDDLGPGTVLENQATVTAIDACDGVTEATDVSEIVEVTLVHPDFTVTKECQTPEVEPGGDAEFKITITNTGDVDLICTTDEPEIPGPFTLPAAGPALEHFVTRPCEGAGTEVCNAITVVATIPPEYCGLPNELTRSDEDCCMCVGEDGCTPGYWKNQPECWCDTYDTEDLICDVFVVPPELDEEFCDDDDTLMDALNFGGGGGIEGKARNLLRQGVAALLNACDPDVSYPMGEAGVIAAINAALATLDEGEMEILKNTFDMYNNYGCPQDAHCRPIPTPTGSEPAFGTPTEDEVMERTQTVVPEEFSVSGYPNPASPSAMIHYALPVASKVTVEILDVQGRSVATLIDRHMPAGTHSLVWNGKDASGRDAASGVYFCRVQCCDGEETMTKVIKVR
jgi:hypothetical protein